MSSATLPFTMPRPVRHKVRMLRWLVRAYVAAEGLAAVVLVLGLLFWFSLGIDWLLEPSTFLRSMMWVTVVLTVSWVATRQLFSRAAARLSDSSLALLVERNYPELAEGLVTTVEAANSRPAAAIVHRKLLDRTAQQTAKAIRSAPLHALFRPQPLLWKLGGAIVVLLSIGMFATFQNEAFGFWLERMRLSQELWPRVVHLSLVDFEGTGGQVINVARDDDFTLQVAASIDNHHRAPEEVEIRYRRADGKRGRDLMTKVGQALAGRDKAQNFRYVFQNVSMDLQFDLHGGDDRIHDLRIHVVERPELVGGFRLECQYPAYLRRGPRTLQTKEQIELPVGAHVACHLESTKRLREISVHDPRRQEELAAAIDASNPQKALFEFDVTTEDRLLLLTLRDEEGVENRQPFRLVVSSILDEPPEISVTLDGIGSAITPQATIPLVGTVSDEYSIEELWFDYQIRKNEPVEKGESSKRDFSFSPRGQREITRFERLDLAKIDENTKRPLIDLKPGQQFAFALQARDAYDLDDAPHVGSSQRFLLDVVTDSELRALLEKRELTLRQRFEAIHEKMLGTQELLARIEVGRGEPKEQSARQSHDRDRLRIGGTVQNAIQLAYETGGVAVGFDDIVAELINNRVEPHELRQRLVDGISKPLTIISSQLLPELKDRLEELQQTFAAPQTGQSAHTAARKQGEVVLEAMKQVLDRMLELESYNELVTLLREIVHDQQQLQEQTKQLRRQQLRNLLDEQ